MPIIVEVHRSTNYKLWDRMAKFPAFIRATGSAHLFKTPTSERKPYTNLYCAVTYTTFHCRFLEDSDGLSYPNAPEFYSMQYIVRGIE